MQTRTHLKNPAKRSTTTSASGHRKNNTCCHSCPEFFMLNAIETAIKGVRKGNSPFGACIVKNNKIIASSHNTVLSANNATHHAEINAISIACNKLKTWNLSGCTIYSTTEPCPMCFSAIHWARIKKVVYGTRIYDVSKLGFSELPISNRTMERFGNSSVRIEEDFMREECLDLLAFWKRRKGRKTY